MREADLAISNVDKMYNTVDDLPKGARWHCRELTVTGDRYDARGVRISETVEVWYRDPLECIRELLGNPRFAHVLAYSPEQVFCDPEGRVRRIDEMHTADWWGQLQVRHQ